MIAQQQPEDSDVPVYRGRGNRRLGNVKWKEGAPTLPKPSRLSRTERKSESDFACSWTLSKDRISSLGMVMRGGSSPPLRWRFAMTVQPCSSLPGKGPILMPSNETEFKAAHAGRVSTGSDSHACCLPSRIMAAVYARTSKVTYPNEIVVGMCESKSTLVARQGWLATSNNARALWTPTDASQAATGCHSEV